MIPKSALLFNTFGQSSCFTISKDKTSFSRHAIELGSPDGELIEVTKGINHSDLVVSIGAEQLAAEDSKGELAVEDDD
jgi:hypothetical protein